MIFPALTVIVAGLLGGALAIGITALVVVAAVALALFALLNGLRIVADFWADLAHD